MFEVCVFHRLKGCFCELIEMLRSELMENMETRWAQGVNNGHPITHQWSKGVCLGLGTGT